MSYNGTVRCSYCYQTGHNRRKCPDLTDMIAKQYQAHISNAKESREAGEINDAEWYESRAELKRQEYIKRTKIDLATGKKVTNKAAKAARMKKVKCGYCGEHGHTRRTCQNLKNDYAIYKVRTREVREDWYNKVKEAGIGIGSMVVLRNHRGYKPDGSYGSMNVTGLVTGIKWDSIDAHRDGSTFIIQSNDSLRGIDEWRSARIPDMNLRSLLQEHANKTVIPSGHAPVLPAGWLDGGAPIKEVFETSEGRRYDYAYHSDGSVTDQIRERLGFPVNAYAS